MAYPPPVQVLSVPLFSQADNRGGMGWRECMSSSCAMVAAFHGRIGSDDDYCLVRKRYGDTTSPQAQILALRELGLSARFITTGDRSKLLEELAAGRPVPVGWLHHGPAGAPCGGGHWSVAAGWAPDAVWMLDPNGEANLSTGGYVSSRKGWQGWYSWRNWGPRWDARPPAPQGRTPGPAGWALLIRPTP